MITELATLQDGVAAFPDEDRGLAWLALGTELATVELSTGDVTVHTDAGRALGGVALSGDGKLVVLTCADGAVLTAAADDPGSGTTELATVAGEALGQAAATRPASGLGSALGVSAQAGRLVAVALSDGQIRTAGTIVGVTGVAALGSRVFAAVTAVGGGRVVKVAAGASQSLATGLLATGHVTVDAAGERLLVVHPGADRVTQVTLADGTVATGATDRLNGAVVEAHGLTGGRVLILTAEALAVADDFSDLKPRPRLVAPTRPLFVLEFHKLQYDLSGSGLGDDEVSFVITDEPDAGFVSQTKTVPGVGGAVQEPFLVVGGMLGEFGLDMIETATGTVLDSVRFEVTDHWHDPDFGPSAFLQGDNAGSPAGDWGGGPNQPQNSGTVRHRGTWRVGVLMANTSDGAYPTDAPGLGAARTAILDELQDGTNVNGTTRSARHYYEELSHWDSSPSTRGLTVRAHGNQVFGPVTLPNGWGSYFQQKKDAAGVVTDKKWSSMGATAQTVISRAIADGVMTTADFSAIDVLLIVPRSPDTVASDGARFVWPHAYPRQAYLCGTSATADQRTFAVVFAPPDFETHDGRRLHATLSHELGHTLGLPDLYKFPAHSQNVVDRLTMGWDLMAGSRNDMPHFTLSNRMRQGWVQDSHLRLFNFSVAPSAGAINENVTLHAAELGTPPSGRVRGIEVRLSDGWNTYVEYRAKQPGQFSDTLPTDRRVVITDVTSDTFTAPIARPPIIFVDNDADGDGPILDTNLDYEEVDPSSQKLLTIKVVSTGADNAVVNVKYDSGQRPDPGIRPWTGGPDWQSPDIEVRNAKSAADSKWRNTPWLGNPNDVIAKVRNNGDLEAKAAAVEFFALPFTTGGEGAWVSLGTDVKDIPAGQTAEFKVAWSPPVIENPHFCIVVRILLYQHPSAPGVFETNIYNNEARSNYTRFVSASSSPSTRAVASVQLSNPFDEETLVHARLTSKHPYHRVFLSHRWLRVGARGNEAVEIYDEALAGFPESDEIDDERMLGMLWKEDNIVAVEGWAERPFAADCMGLTLTGGAAVSVGAGRATGIEITEAHTSYIAGRVWHVDDGSPVNNGTVIAVARELEEFGGTVTGQGELDDGRFSIEFRGSLPGDKQVGEAEFLGSFGAAPCRSETVELRT